MFKKLIDGKPVIIKSSSKNIPSFETIKKVYRKIPDNKNIPIVFETKKQYLKEYIRNQEIKKNIDFTPSQEKAYISRELKDMNNVVSRYTTKKNPYIDLRTVFFTDKKITPKQFQASAFHEYAHEEWENNPRIRKDWQAVNKTTAPTPYGRTDRQEDFAESYMLYKMGRLKDPKRTKIFSDNGLNRKSYDPKKVHPAVKKIARISGGLPEDEKEYNEGMKELGIDLDSEDRRFDSPVKPRYPGRKGFSINLL